MADSRKIRRSPTPPPSVEELAARARTAAGDELGPLLHQRHDEVLRGLLENPNLHELQRIRLLRRRDLPPWFFEQVARDKQWMDQYAVRLAIARNPKVPMHVLTRICSRFLPFDLVKIISDPHLGYDRKLFLNRIIVERVPGMPLGTKVSLARRAGPDVVEALLREKPPRRLIAELLESRYMTEVRLVRAVGGAIRDEDALALIHDHKEWGRRYPILVALAKNPHFAQDRRRRVLAGLRPHDLKEVMRDCARHRHIVRPAKAELDTRSKDGRREEPRPMTRDEIEAALRDLKPRGRAGAKAKRPLCDAVPGAISGMDAAIDDSAGDGGKRSAAEIRGAAIRELSEEEARELVRSEEIDAGRFRAMRAQGEEREKLSEPAAEKKTADEIRGGSAEALRAAFGNGSGGK